jgi:hypothetical protein
MMVGTARCAVRIRDGPGDNSRTLQRGAAISATQASDGG